MYAVFMLLQPAQRRCDNDVVKVLLITVGGHYGDWTMSPLVGCYGDHPVVILNVRLCNRYCRDSAYDLLVIGWYEAVVYDD